MRIRLSQKNNAIIMCFLSFFAIFGLEQCLANKVANDTPTWPSTLKLVKHHFPNVVQMSTKELANRLKRDTLPPILIDTRTIAEYKASHLRHAIHAENKYGVLEKLVGVSPDRLIVLYCSVGYRSSEIIKQLSTMGAKHRLVNLEGSIFKWANEGRALYRQTPNTVNSQKAAYNVHPFNSTWGTLLNKTYHPNTIEKNTKKLKFWRMQVATWGLIALLILESLLPFFAFFKSAKQRFRHGLKNLIIGWINALVMGLCFVGIWQYSAEWSALHEWGLLHHIAPERAIYALPLAVLMLDCWTYWWHRMAHVFSFLWRFHSVHHNDPRMDVTTGNRFHLVEIIISSLLRIPLIAILGITMKQLLIYEICLLFLVQIQHANIAFPPLVEKCWRIFFVSPNMHKIHHSVKRVETDSNYSSFLSIWDRLFGSFCMHNQVAKINIGLNKQGSTEKQTFISLMKQPFQHNGKS